MRKKLVMTRVMMEYDLLEIFMRRRGGFYFYRFLIASSAMVFLLGVKETK